MSTTIRTSAWGRLRRLLASATMEHGKGAQVDNELKTVIELWWKALKAHLGVDDEIAGQIESGAWRSGAKDLQRVDRRHVSNWRSRGLFPPTDPHLQKAAVQLMEQMAAEVGAPEGVGRWTSPAELHQAWLASRKALEDAPQPRTVEANARKARQLADVLVGDVDRTVDEATTLEGLRTGFWQGSWITDDETPPYVPRTIDTNLRSRLDDMAASGEGGLVVVVGPPKAGKTRALLEALRVTMPDRRLWQLKPVDGALDAAITAVESDGGRQGPFNPADVVVLIDDLQRHNFHTATGIDDKTLGRAIRHGLMVVATLHDDALTRMQAYAHDHSRLSERHDEPIGATPGLTSLLVDARIDLAPGFNEQEIAQLPDSLTDLDTVIAAVQRNAHLPELFAAVDALEARARHGIVDRDHPELAAIIAASLDAHHLYPTGATLTQLEQLTQWAYERDFPTRYWDPYLFTKALDWATTPIGGPGSIHAVFQRSELGGNTVGVFDPLVNRLQGKPWDPTHLTTHLEQLDPDACYLAALHGSSTLTLQERIIWASRGAESAHARALDFLARLHESAGHFQEAERWYLTSARTDDPEYSWASLSHLAHLQVSQGHLADAQRTMGLACDRVDDPGGDVMWVFSEVCRKYGFIDASDWWLNQAALAGSGRAMHSLGHKLQNQGESGGSERWMIRAAASGYPEREFRDAQRAIDDFSPDDEQSHAARQVAMAGCLGHPEALSLLANAVEASGDHDEAAALRHRVDQPSTTLDLLSRGVMHLMRDEQDEARKWLEQAAHLGEPEAMFRLATLLPTERAEAWYERAADNGHPRAMLMLGLLQKDRAPEQSKNWLRRAAEEGEVRASRALASLASDPDEAEHWLIISAQLHDTTSIEDLGWHYIQQGDLDQAEAWLRRIDNTPRAQLLMSQVSQARGDQTQSEEWMTRAARQHDPTSLVIRGEYDWRHGKPDQARGWWNELLDLETAEAKSSRADVGIILAHANDPEAAEMWFAAASLSREELLAKADWAEELGETIGAEMLRRRAESADCDSLE